MARAFYASSSGLSRPSWNMLPLTLASSLLARMLLFSFGVAIAVVVVQVREAIAWDGIPNKPCASCMVAQQLAAPRAECSNRVCVLLHCVQGFP